MYLSKIVSSIVDAYKNELYSIDLIVDFNNTKTYEESEMDKDQYKCIAVYSDSCMIIYGIEEVEELLNDGWLIDETIHHDDFVMYIIHHFPVDGEE